MAGLEDLLALYATETTDRVPGGAVFVRRRDDYVELRQRGATAFAVWVKSGDQPGLHVRSHGAGSTSTFKPGTHNWIYLYDVIDPAVIAASREICRMRAGGVAAIANDLYKPLAKAVALLSLKPELLHAGGPRAKILSGERDVAVALCDRCRRRTMHLARPDDAELLAKIDHAFAEGKGGYAHVVSYKTAKVTRDAEAAESAPVQCARAWIGASNAGSQSCMTYAIKALVRAIGDLERDDPDAASAFAIELDDLILEHELVAAYRKLLKRDDDPPTVARVLWRGADTKGFPAYWLARLADGNYALLAKLGNRWGWHVADRDNTLATVPDELLDLAAEMTLLRDRG